MTCGPWSMSPTSSGSPMVPKLSRRGGLNSYDGWPGRVSPGANPMRSPSVPAGLIWVAHHQGTSSPHSSASKPTSRTA